MKDTAIIITSYCGGTAPDAKRKMTKTLCKRSKQLHNFVCLASHSSIDEETQEYCDMFVYDANNSFKVNGLPTLDHVNGHGVAELVSTHNAVNLIERLGFKYFLKLAFDSDPNADYNEVIYKSRETNKKLVTGNAGANTLGTHAYFCEIEFFKNTFSLNEVYRCDKFHGGNAEFVWFDSISEKGSLDDVLVLEFHDFFGHDIRGFSHNGGTFVRDYNF